MDKVTAWKSVNIEDKRTGRLYLLRAQALGLLDLVKSKEDGRTELVIPTQLLVDAVKREFELLAEQLPSRPFAGFFRVQMRDDDVDPIDMEDKRLMEARARQNEALLRKK